MEGNPLTPNWGQMVPGMIFMVIWAVVSIAALLAFFRGMRALTEIARTLARIEQRLAGRDGSDPYGAS